MSNLHFQQLLQEQRCRDGVQLLKAGIPIKADTWQWKNHEWRKVLINKDSIFYVAVYWDNEIYDVYPIGKIWDYVWVEYLLILYMRSNENEGNEFLGICTR